ncbi:MAG: TonB-dependent receptor [Tannerella sp.]|jgi:hypothetical protein|nr:TonB-dependent receptor [Tannerella sp.]
MKLLIKIWRFGVLSFFAFPVFLAAQPVGNIRGVVTDDASGRVLSDVSVVALYSNPVIGTLTDSTGYFLLDSLPVGRYNIHVSRMGYEPVVFKEIMVTSAKEVFLEIALRENVQGLKEIPDWTSNNKEKPNNRMAITSARTFSIDEASRYAGGYDDPARLVTAYAGVSGSVGNNGVAIRGNSPQYLQWRIEGVEAVNPTHFSDITGAGSGIITALSPYLLGSSDFFTGAFPAEYGNALSGVFDIQLRNGNHQRYEHSAQIGTLGVEVATEGPFAKGQQASYLFNYRYSSLSLIGDVFPKMVGEAAGIRFQDFSFKINFPTQKAGTVSVWGIGSNNHFRQRAFKNTKQWQNTFANNADYLQTKGIGGIGHQISIGEKAYLKSALAVNCVQNQITMEQVYVDKTLLPVQITNMNSENWSVTFNTFLNTKFNASHTNRTGFNVTKLFFDLDYSISPDIHHVPPGDMVNYAMGKGSSTLFSAFSQSSFRLNSRLTANVGLLGMYFQLNGKATVEPRAGIRWQASPKQTFGMAYGKHSRRENLDYYFVEISPREGAVANKKLGFSKAHHFVLAYEWAITEHLSLKAEPYYQYLYAIPVTVDNNRSSLINHRDFYMMTPLVNGGKGKNYGIDCTLEHHFHNGYYYLLTASLFDSRATEGDDDVWKHTRLNRNYIFNSLGGKEWKTGKQKQNILSASIRFTLQGGERYIPVDEEKSRASKGIILDRSKAYEEQMPSEFISHLTLGFKINCNKLTHLIAIKIINATGIKDFDKYSYNYHTGRPEMYMKSGMLPNISYLVNF